MNAKNLSTFVLLAAMSTSCARDPESQRRIQEIYDRRAANMRSTRSSEAPVTALDEATVRPFMQALQGDVVECRHALWNCIDMIPRERTSAYETWSERNQLSDGTATLQITPTQTASRYDKARALVALNRYASVALDPFDATRSCLQSIVAARDLCRRDLATCTTVLQTNHGYAQKSYYSIRSLQQRQ
ncbi:hypothetical protein KA517_01065 [Candidatus Gracilibacteria bacterium]|nr:hypothetical protein [Candidatus Gracilibacteria bacterium]